VSGRRYVATSRRTLRAGLSNGWWGGNACGPRSRPVYVRFAHATPWATRIGLMLALVAECVEDRFETFHA